MSVEVFAEHADELGESPLWSHAEQALYWIDIGAKQLYRRTLRGDQAQWTIPGRPGFVESGSEGALLLGFGEEISVFTPASATLKRLMSLNLPRGVRFNEGRADPKGRLWFGSMQDNYGPGGIPIAIERSVGQLFRLDLSGIVSAVQEGIGIANTLVWSPDETRFYSADSVKGSIFVYDYDAGTGHVANKRLFYHAPALGVPDGSAMDTDGCIWNARWGAGKVVRITPSGDLDQELEIPALQPTSCAFGGPDRSTLFVTSARLGLTPEQLAEQPRSGSVFAIEGLAQGLRASACHSSSIADSNGLQVST
jgi:sugar lactone lactonase YvrE